MTYQDRDPDRNGDMRVAIPAKLFPPFLGAGPQLNRFG